MEIFTIKKKKRKEKKDQEERQRQWNKRDSVGLSLCSLPVRPPPAQRHSPGEQPRKAKARPGGLRKPQLGPAGLFTRSGCVRRSM